jgi:hypothetical protein
MCLLSSDEKLQSAILPPTSTKFEAIKKKDGGLISPSHLPPKTQDTFSLSLYIYRIKG